MAATLPTLNSLQSFNAFMGHLLGLRRRAGGWDALGNESAATLAPCSSKSGRGADTLALSVKAQGP